MRVALLTLDWRPTGGIASHLHLVAPALARAGHDVLVVHSSVSAETGGPGVRILGLPGYLSDRGAVANRDAIPAVTGALRDFAPDVVHVHNDLNPHMSDALHAGFRLVHTVHALDLCPAGTKWHSTTNGECHYVTGPLCLPRMVYLRCTLSKRPHLIWRRFIHTQAANRRLRQLPQVVVASEFVRQLAITNGVDGDRVSVIPYFTSTSPSVPPAGRDRTVLFVGRVVHEKGVDLLLSALRMMGGDWRLVIVGDGIGMTEVRSLVRDTGLTDRVAFRGWLGDDALSTAYRDAAVVVVPSRWPEPFGIVGIEALAHARPVVAFATGGIPEWLQDGDGGYLAPQGDVRALSGRIRHVLDHPAEAARAAALGRARVAREYSEAAHLSRLLPLYERVRAGQH